MTRILVAEPEEFSARALEVLQGAGEVTVAACDARQLAEAFTQYDVVWFRLAHRVDAPMLGARPKCRVLATPVTGLDQIDLVACEARGIRVLSLKGEREFLKRIRATAELTIGLMLALLRRIPQARASVLDGVWNRDLFVGHELFEKTAGIVGMGRLGTIVADYLSAFGMEVIGYDGGNTAALHALLRRADVVSIHAVYDPSTHHLIGRGELACMKPTAVLINTARGGIVDDEALLEALVQGRLAGAALDVLAGEPHVPKDHPLIAYARAHDNLLIVPHIGGKTAESMERTEIFLAEKVVRALRESP